MTVGDILEVSVNHPTVGAVTFFPKSNEDSTLDLGGFRSNDDANMIDGGGNIINQKNRVRWSFECTLANDFNVREDIEKLNALTDSNLEGSWTVTHINGAVYTGAGFVVGDLNANGNTGNISLKVAGSGKLKKILG